MRCLKDMHVRRRQEKVLEISVTPVFLPSLWVCEHVHRGRAVAPQRKNREPLVSSRASDHSSCGPRTVAPASPGSLFEMLALRLHPRPNDGNPHFTRFSR